MLEANEKSCCGPTCCAEPSPVSRVEEQVATVRERYGRIAEGLLPACCGTDSARDASGALGYGAGELSDIPEESNLGLGCGAPLAFLRLVPGETVLDLGSGGGIDAFLAARQVGPAGRVIGVDMTPQMIERARAAAARLGFASVVFRLGRLEALPVADGSVDAVTSNCAINLVPDKGAVFGEIARVLRPGGRLVISDVVLDGRLPAAIETDLLAHAGCISGALRREAYFALVGAAGLTDVEVLSDVDQLLRLIDTAPEEVRAIAQRTGVSLADVAGRVRSVTFTARRPA
jgi:SAM-dependent methyltransferase